MCSREKVVFVPSTSLAVLDLQCDGPIIGILSLCHLIPAVCPHISPLLLFVSRFTEDFCRSQLPRGQPQHVGLSLMYSAVTQLLLVLD